MISDSPNALLIFMIGRDHGTSCARKKNFKLCIHGWVMVKIIGEKGPYATHLSSEVLEKSSLRPSCRSRGRRIWHTSHENATSEVYVIGVLVFKQNSLTHIWNISDTSLLFPELSTHSVIAFVEPIKLSDSVSPYSLYNLPSWLLYELRCIRLQTELELYRFFDKFYQRFLFSVYSSAFPVNIRICFS